jgi:hypothetical protein
MECGVRESSEADRRNLFKPTGAIFSSRQAQSSQADRRNLLKPTGTLPI